MQKKILSEQEYIRNLRAVKCTKKRNTLQTYIKFLFVFLCSIFGAGFSLESNSFIFFAVFFALYFLSFEILN